MSVIAYGCVLLLLPLLVLGSSGDALFALRRRT